MSKEDRKIKRAKRNKRRIVLISFILIYFIFRSVPTLYASTLKTTLVEEGFIEDIASSNGVLIKNEKVYRAGGEGKATLYKKEGEKVKVGTLIASISLVSDNSALKEELNGINKKIDSLEKVNKNREDIKNDKDKNLKTIDGVIDQIQKDSMSGEYTNIPILKEELNSQLGKKKDISGDNTLVNNSLENLKERKKELEKEISNNTIKYFSQESGIISYKLDGLEEIYSGEKMDSYTIDNAKKIQGNAIKVDNGNLVKAGDPILKIMDNFNWYLLVSFDNWKDISTLKKGDNVYIRINKKDEKIKGNIIRIENKNNKGLIVIQSNSYFHDYYLNRYVNVDIIKKRYEGLKIPTESVVEKEGIKGVYIKDISGIIKFRPIKILGQNEEYTIADKGDKNSYIKLEGSDEKKKTLRLFDELLLNGNNVKEGQIID